MGVDAERNAFILVASGRGSRMGGPKALLLWGDVPLPLAHASSTGAVCARVVVVARDAVVRRLRPLAPGIRFVTSAAPEGQGPAGSLSAAVRSGALEDTSWAVITPVDLVPLRSQTVRTLLARASDGVDAIRPRFEGRGGHPVVVRTDVLVAHYLRPSPRPLRDVLAALGDRCVDVVLQDPDVRADLDTPAAWEERTGLAPRFLA